MKHVKDCEPIFLVTGKKRIVGSVHLLINLHDASWILSFQIPTQNNPVKAKKVLKERYESKRDAIAIDHTKWIPLYVHKNV